MNREKKRNGLLAAIVGLSLLLFGTLCAELLVGIAARNKVADGTVVDTLIAWMGILFALLFLFAHFHQFDISNLALIAMYHNLLRCAFHLHQNYYNIVSFGFFLSSIGRRSENSKTYSDHSCYCYKNESHYVYSYHQLYNYYLL